MERSEFTSEKIIATQTTINDILGEEDDINKKSKEMPNISLEVFDGPLDALYNLVIKHKIEIQDIPISEITKQLINYLKNVTDVELSGDLLNMASRLLYLKSAYLLKKHRAIEEELALREEEEEIARQLKLKLEEYSKYKIASETIMEKMDLINRPYFRNAPEIIVQEDFSTENIDKTDIYKALQQMTELEIEKLKSNMLGKINDSKLKQIYKNKILRVEDRIQKISETLTNREELVISEYIKEYSKENKIVTFLAILEMCKANQITIQQEYNYGEIYIRKVVDTEKDIEVY